MKTIVQLETNLVKPYIDAKDEAVEKNIAPVENGTTAVGSYAIGEQFIREDILYKAKTAITAGDTLTLDTNYEVADDVTTQVSSLKQDLSDEVKTRATLGAHNLWEITQPSNPDLTGLSFTVNDDKTVTVNGTSTVSWSFITNPKTTLKAGTYILSSGIGANANLYVQITSEDQQTEIVSTSTQDNVEFTLNADTVVVERIFYTIGQTFNNIVVKPMLRLASDTDDTYQPFAMTNQQLTPYAQSQSNPNLLDNPWFTVNQRGQSTYSGEGYCVDRWYSVGTSKDVSANGITMSAGANNIVQQPIEDELLAALNGNVVTLSALFANKGLVKVTGTFPNISGNDNGYVLAIAANVWPQSTRTAFRVWINDATIADTLKAVKLELGTVSTLENDVKPNYAEELLKCQRYFVRFNQYITITNAHGKFDNSIHVEMRATPTILSKQASYYSAGTWIDDTANADVIGQNNQFVRVLVNNSSNPETEYVVTFEASADF